jgi:hypothetical protein
MHLIINPYKTQSMKKTLLSLVIMLLGFSVMAQNGTTLKLNLEKNHVYRLKSTSDQTISQTMNGMQQTTNVTSNSLVSIKMMDASADFVVAEFHFDTLITVTNAMGKIVNINSANEGNIKSSESGDVMTAIMNRLSKNPLYVKMDYTGKILELVNAKMLSDILLKDTASITGETAPMIKMQIANMVSEKALISMAEAFTHNLPGKPVATGDKWDITENMNAGGMSLDLISTYSLVGIKDNIANLTSEMSIQASPNAEPLSYGPAKVMYDELKGMGKSEVALDTRTGLLIQSTSKTHLAGNLNISVQGMSLQMPMEMDGTSKVVSLQ